MSETLRVRVWAFPFRRANRTANPELRLVILLALLSGLRRGEIFGLRWQDINWTADVIQVKQNLYYRHGKYHEVPEGETSFVLSPPKSEKSIRDVDLSPALKKELRARYMESEDKHGLIFQSSTIRPWTRTTSTNDGLSQR